MMHRISNHLLTILSFLVFSITTQQWYYSLAEEYDVVAITANGNELTDDTKNDILESTFAEQKRDSAYSHGRKLHYAQIIKRMEWKKIMRMRMRNRSDDSSYWGSDDNIFHYAAGKGKGKGMIYYGNSSRMGGSGKGSRMGGSGKGSGMGGSRMGGSRMGGSRKGKKKEGGPFFPLPFPVMMRWRMMMMMEFRSSRPGNMMRGRMGMRRRMMRSRRRMMTMWNQPSITPSTPAGPSPTTGPTISLSPTLSSNPSSNPSVSLSPSQSSMPSSVPSTPGPTLAVDDAIDLQLRIDYTWFPNSGVAPTQEEIDEMVAVTNPFFLSQIQASLPPTFSFDGTVTDSSYDAATEFFTSTWDTVTTGSGTSRENLGEVVLAINAQDYITEALWSLPGNTFENIQAVAIEVL